MSKERSWIPTIHQQTKYFGKPFANCVGKVEVTRPSSRIQLQTSSGMRRKSFHIGENTLKIC